jgi:hypothetical protein
MNRIVAATVAILLACASARAEKSVSQWIADLAVKDQGNFTCNTASSALTHKGEEAVPALADALRNENERVRYYAVRCLGQINTKTARSALIDAFFNGKDDVREQAAYALTWKPARDAEQVYIAVLGGHNEWRVRSAIKALGEIRSAKAAPYLTRIRDNPPGWHSYYAVVVALRKIESREFSSDIQGALDFLRKAKYSRRVNGQRLSDSASIIKQNIRETVPDVFDIFLWVTKGSESPATPNAKTILHEAGPLAYPVVRIGLNDPDLNVSRDTKALVEEFKRNEMLGGDLQQDGATTGSQPIRSETNPTSPTAGSRR